jgi:hypothetical protein
MAWIAANVPAEESDVRVTHPLAEVEAEIAPELFMREARLSRPLLRGAMLFFLLQAIFSKILQGRQNESA